MRAYPTGTAAKILAEGLPVGPHDIPCVCGGPRHRHGGKTAAGPDPTTGCRKYRPDKAWELAYDAADAVNRTLGDGIRAGNRVLATQRRAANPVEPGQWRIGASDTGTCPRLIWYRNCPPDDYVPAYDDKREADAGSMLDEGMEKRLRLIYPWREFQREVTIPGLDRRSRLDWWDPITQTVADNKTAGRWRWSQVGDHGPAEPVWGQASLYGLALEAEGETVRTVRVDYYNRENGHDEMFTRPYDRRYAEGWRDLLVSYATSLDMGLVLPRAGEGPDRDPLCKRCPARNHCWDIPAAEAAGRSPYSWVMFGRNPDDQAAEAAIAAYLQAQDAERTAKARVAEAADLLAGIEPRRYGAMESWEQWSGGGPAYKAYAEALQEHYATPEAQRPALDDIPVPKATRSRVQKFGRVRKATLDREAKQTGEETS